MRIAHTTPPKCSGCFNQQPGKVHVDFESAYEGPLIDEARPRGGHIDWLVICEDCIRRAAELLPEYRSRLDAQREIAEAARAAAAEASARAASLEVAIAALTAKPAEYEVERPPPIVEEPPARKPVARKSARKPKAS